LITGARVTGTCQAMAVLVHIARAIVRLVENRA
jgi:hypothetical protein